MIGPGQVAGLSLAAEQPISGCRRETFEMNKVLLEDLPDVLKPEEAAKVLRLGRNSLYEAIRRKEIPVVRIGRRLLVPKAALIRLLGGDD
jgi:excisionase family DNA binding protein